MFFDRRFSIIDGPAFKGYGMVGARKAQDPETGIAQVFVIEYGSIIFSVVLPKRMIRIQHSFDGYFIAKPIKKITRVLRSPGVPVLSGL